MLKLFFFLIVALLLALAVLGLRHHTMELQAQSARLRDKIRQQENMLRDQDPEIAKATNPLVLAERLKKAGADNAGEPPASDGSVGGLYPQADLNALTNANPMPRHNGRGLVTVSNVSPAARSRHWQVH
jgi:hypothetical protein